MNDSASVKGDKGIMTRYRIKRPNFVQVGEGKDNFAVCRNTTSYETSVASLRYNTNASVITPLDNVADLLCGLRSEDRGGRAFIFPHPI
jgi:hypothetical protein